MAPLAPGHCFPCHVATGRSGAVWCWGNEHCRAQWGHWVLPVFSEEIIGFFCCWGKYCRLWQSGWVGVGLLSSWGHLASVLWLHWLQEAKAGCCEGLCAVQPQGRCDCRGDWNFPWTILSVISLSVRKEARQVIWSTLWCVVPGKETSGSPEAPQWNAAPLSNGCLVFLNSLGFTALMQSGDLHVLVWCCGILVLQGILVVTSDSPKQCFPPFCGIWLLNLCEDIDCPWCTGGWTQAERCRWRNNGLFALIS